MYKSSKIRVKILQQEIKSDFGLRLFPSLLVRFLAVVVTTLYWYSGCEADKGWQKFTVTVSA